MAEESIFGTNVAQGTLVICSVSLHKTVWSSDDLPLGTVQGGYRGNSTFCMAVLLILLCLETEPLRA